MVIIFETIENITSRRVTNVSVLKTLFAPTNSATSKGKSSLGYNAAQPKLIINLHFALRENCPKIPLVMHKIEQVLEFCFCRKQNPEEEEKE